MANIDGPITCSVQGTARTFTGFGFTPTHLDFEVVVKSNSGAIQQRCIGSVDSGGYMQYHYSFDDGTTIDSSAGTDRCIFMKEKVSGVLTEVLRATFHSFTSDGFKLNVTTASGSYPVHVKATNV